VELSLALGVMVALVQLMLWVAMVTLVAPHYTPQEQQQ